jgi:hypothetical protein
MSRATVIPFYALRLRHLTVAKAELVVSCGACRRSASLPVLDLAYAHGPDTGVRELERRLRCQHCGRKGWATIRVEWLG